MNQYHVFKRKKKVSILFPAASFMEGFLFVGLFVWFFYVVSLSVITVRISHRKLRDRERTVSWGPGNPGTELASLQPRV